MPTLSCKVWGNALFLLPAILSLQFGLYAHAVIVFAVICSSTAYHRTDEKKWGLVDRIASLLLITYNLYLFYLSNFRQPYFSIALLCVVLAFYCKHAAKKSNYNLYHSCWHFASIAITTASVLAYAY